MAVADNKSQDWTEVTNWTEVEKSSRSTAAGQEPVGERSSRSKRSLPRVTAAGLNEPVGVSCLRRGGLRSKKSSKKYCRWIK